MRQILSLSALLFALIPASPAKGEILLETPVDTNRVRAALVNAGPRPVKLFVGFECSSSDSSRRDTAAFQLEVDGEPRPPSVCGASARSRVPRFVMLEPGERYEIGLAAHDQELDQGAHRVVVRYRGERRCAGCWKGVLQSAPQSWPSTLSLMLNAVIERDGRVEVVIEHRNASAGPMAVYSRNACQLFEMLLVDGGERLLVESPPCEDHAPRIEALAPNASLVVRSVLQLPPGTHTLEARYRVQRSADFKLVQGGHATAFDFSQLGWSGTVSSSPVTIDVR